MLDKTPVALIIATKNQDKFKEIQAFFETELNKLNTRFSFHSLLNVNIPETVEDQETLHQNAEKKSLEAFNALKDNFEKRIVIADDTGLIVPSLGGAPGVFSARYASDKVQGRKPTYDENVSKLLSEMEGSQARDAYFLTVMAITHNLNEKRECVFVEGKLEGEILIERRGTNGFGYDPVFLISNFDKTLAELTMEEKNQISHRAKALQGAKLFLQSLFENVSE
ncbi:MAG: RdgB/HAM1 family non-canonical purine NTP pyrophosphatase [Chloroherpetonaceae bacterium]|nr:RdgB/HAM1 family non-canonical purine NTP pyrophosphatase [Chloroherpetonaceae bacterium]